MSRPVFGVDRDPVAAAGFRMPTPEERDAQWRRDQAAWARKHPICSCECPECDADGIHEAHEHVPAMPECEVCGLASGCACDELGDVDGHG